MNSNSCFFKKFNAKTQFVYESLINNLNKMISKQKPKTNKIINLQQSQKRDIVLLNFLSIYLDVFKFSYSTFFLSVEIFNSLIPVTQIQNVSLKSIFMTCFRIAFKMKESQTNCMEFDEMFNSDTILMFNVLEKRIPTALNYELNISTSFDFLCTFLEFDNFSMSQTYLNTNLPIAEFSKASISMLVFAVVSSKSKKFSNLNLAVSVVVLSQKLFGLKLRLPFIIEDLLNRDYQSFELCKQFLKVNSKCIEMNVDSCAKSQSCADC